jgi:hypothetical protein
MLAFNLVMFLLPAAIILLALVLSHRMAKKNG